MGGVQTRPMRTPPVVCEALEKASGMVWAEERLRGRPVIAVLPKASSREDANRSPLVLRGHSKKLAQIGAGKI